VYGTRALKPGRTVVIPSVALVALFAVAGCAPSGAVGVEPADALGPVVVTAPTVPSTPLQVTVPTTLPTTTTTTTTLAPTTVATTTTTLAPPVGPPGYPVQVVKRGSRGEMVKVLQGRLLETGFWLDAPDGHYGPATTQAVMAFQKYYGVSDRSGRVDQATADALNSVRTKPVPVSKTGDLIEVDKARQVLFIVRGGKALWTLNTSTGSGRPYTELSKKEPGKQLRGNAQTPDGNYKVNRERAAGWWEGELGKLYRPKYFRGGIAVHGSNSIPNHPASHGCVRVTTVAMDFIWANNLMPMGSPVWVHS
jgi:peptidoglycan hydrolase-like protein with peptidoglycan-binding domain